MVTGGNAVCPGEEAMRIRDWMTSDAMHEGYYLLSELKIKGFTAPHPIMTFPWKSRAHGCPGKTFPPLGMWKDVSFL